MTCADIDVLRQVVNIGYFAQRKCGFRPDAHQQEIFMTCGKRTILNCSRQTGKSTTAALKAVHTAYFQHGSTVLVTAPTKQQTREFIRKARNFAALAGASLRGAKDAVFFKNGSRIVGIASNEDTVRGFSAISLLIVDEASRVNDEVYFALLPMLAVTDGNIWLMSTPKGKRGFFHAEWASAVSERWIKIRTKAADCIRISADFLEAQKRRLGERRFAQEFECVFIDIDHGVFHPDAVRGAFTDNVKPLDL